MIDCAICGNKVNYADQRQCESDDHRKLGRAFCNECCKQQGDQFFSPHLCKECAPVNQQPKFKAGKKPIKRKKPNRKKTDPASMGRLRKKVGVYQYEMADMLGISERWYQKIESEEKAESDTVAYLAWFVCRQYAPDLLSEWPMPPGLEKKDADKV